MRLRLLALALIPVAATALAAPAVPDTALVPDQIRAAAAVAGVTFAPAEIDSMLPDVIDQLESILSLRAHHLPNGVPPAFVFDPRPVGCDPGSYLDDGAATWSDPGPVTRPRNLDDLAFASVGQLSALIHTRQVTSVELTRLCLDRLQRFDPELHCVVTLTSEHALQAAARADSELAAGHDRGPLHGIPFGAKDLMAVPDQPTTWGARPYEDQVIDDVATPIARLEEAGAVLVAKLSCGALAWGDVWFGGLTRNPWNLEQGSSGSSAGSASAVAAGLVPFALGTETLGSIVSPCTRCGCTGLRPSFGRVSRAGTMALSWTMDKIGPIARTVEDCALVFDVIRGPDGRDATVVDLPFAYRPDVDLAKLRIGYLAQDFDDDDPARGLDLAALDVLRGLGADLVPLTLPDLGVGDLGLILTAEAAAAFDDLTTSGRDTLLVRQSRDAWPNVFRAARLIPAVDYIQASRVRWQLVQAMGKLMDDVDVYVSPAFAGTNLLVTNLTGQPCVVLPDGFAKPDQPHSLTFIGRLDDEATVLAVARAYQEATDFHRQHPAGF